MSKKTVQEFIKELDDKFGGSWVAVEGAHALTKVTGKDVNTTDKKITFHPGSGLLVKAFFNQATNEIKLYPALLFEDSFDDDHRK